MSKAILAAIPIKPFGVAKRRLRGRLDRTGRSRLGKGVAARTADAAIDAGALVAVVTGDPGVARWARARGYLVIDERFGEGSGLDRAAAAATFEAARRQRPWAVVHADLPLVTPGALAAVFHMAAVQTILVPSHNGGTNVVAGNGVGFRFAYGPGSLQRHLARNPRARVMTNAKLALDLDTEEDLDRALQAPGGRWLREVLA